MRREIIEAGKSVEDAIDSACQKLGCEREDCQWEILDLPKRGFLGLKNSPARVRVSIGEPEEPPVKENLVADAPPKPEPQKPAAQKKQRPKKEPKPAAPISEEKPVVSATPPDEDSAAQAALAASYLAGVLEQIGLSQARIETSWEDGGACLRIMGEGMGVIIGRRGETLDALQYLCSLVANRARDGYLRITVDCGDYRFKRKATLESLAKKLSAQAIKTSSNKTLEPMNPFERRIIHATVSEIEGVSSTSTGEEPHRRVVILCAGAKKSGRPPRSGEKTHSGSAISDRPDWPDKGAKGDRPDDATSPPPRRGAARSGGRRDDRKPGSGGRGGGRRDGRRDRPPAYQPSKEPDVQPSEADNKPLYGKIDLE